MDCTTCEQKCSGTSGVSKQSCMQANCPSCIVSGTICDNQDDFNHAFREAIKYTRKKEKLSTLASVIILLIIFLLLLWALVLANRVMTHKILHYLLALVFSPAYILAYYLNGN